MNKTVRGRREKENGRGLTGRGIEHRPWSENAQEKETGFSKRKIEVLPRLLNHQLLRVHIRVHLSGTVGRFMFTCWSDSIHPETPLQVLPGMRPRCQYPPWSRLSTSVYHQHNHNLSLLNTNIMALSAILLRILTFNTDPQLTSTMVNHVQLL